MGIEKIFLIYKENVERWEKLFWLKQNQGGSQPI